MHVHGWYLTQHGWEYWQLEPADQYGCAMCYVQGMACEFGQSTFSTWLITKHGWEYYILDPPIEGNAFGVVMGLHQEMGSFNLEEVAPYVTMTAEGDDLYELAPPEEWEWSDVA